LASESPWNDRALIPPLSTPSNSGGTTRLPNWALPFGGQRPGRRRWTCYCGRGRSWAWLRDDRPSTYARVGNI